MVSRLPIGLCTLAAGLALLLPDAAQARALPDQTACTATFIAATAGDWSTPANWSGGRIPDATDQVCLGDGAPITVSTAVTVASIEGTRRLRIVASLRAGFAVVADVELLGGEFRADSTISVTGSLNWSGGTLNAAGGATIASGALAEVAGSSAVLAGRLEVAGTLRLDSNSDLSGQGGAEIHNSGSITHVAGSTPAFLRVALDNDGELSTPEGPFYLTGGSPTGAINTGAYTAAGAGAITFTAGSTTLQANTLHGPIVITGAALRVLGGSTTFTAPLFVSGSLSVAGDLTLPGTVNLAGGALQADGAISVTGSLNWSGGTLNAAGGATIASGALAEVAGSSAVLAGRLEVAGTLRLDSNSDLSGQGGAEIHNSGSITHVAGSTPAFLRVALDNDGELSTPEGPFYLTGGSPTGAINTGAYTAAGAGAITFTAGSTTLQANTLHGPIVITGAALRVNGQVTVDRLNLTGGALGGAGRFDVTEEFEWSGGSVAMTGVLRLGRDVAAHITGSVSLANATLHNLGTVTLTPGQSLTLGGRAHMRNEGMFLVDGTSSIVGGTDTLIFNAGVVRKGASSTTVAWSVPFENDGVLEVVRGELWSGSTFRQTADGIYRPHVGGDDRSRLTTTLPAALAGRLEPVIDVALPFGGRARLHSGPRDGEFTEVPPPGYTFDATNTARLDIVASNPAPELAPNAVVPRDEVPAVSAAPPAAEPSPNTMESPAPERELSVRHIVARRSDGQFLLRVPTHRSARFTARAGTGVRQVRAARNGVIRGTLQHGARRGDFKYRTSAKARWIFIAVLRP
ncbi:hypothetical protein OM076_13335 [Solirubrobacter ginsenosidimutans]|uniref:Uncharacterized protein n=1 Tax=Solirubrobacter ginsenosidimutans TaxID=490573 RepID=A0A9X3MRG7_9ACTN|nr:hypothetical protein [Solirubrobacter ginsenosidimutans]MDA0161254.1 hypothetical protein [Solirubrobacter ginsenosidimutans]